VQGERFQIWGLGWMAGCRKNMRFSTENWPYLGNSERYGQGYY